MGLLPHEPASFASVHKMLANIFTYQGGNCLEKTDELEKEEGIDACLFFPLGSPPRYYLQHLAIRKKHWKRND